MLLRASTYHLNFCSAYLRPLCDTDPGIASQLNGIDGIRNHSLTQAKVVLGDRIGDTIPRVVERLAHRPGIAEIMTWESNPWQRGAPGMGPQHHPLDDMIVTVGKKL